MTVVDEQKRFGELKQKYQGALAQAEKERIQLQNLHVQDNKLFVRGTAPSEDAKGRFWSQVKQANPAADDIVADITVQPGSSSASGGSTQSYTVKSGDTLSKISRQFYGDANEYTRIFQANRQTISDPDKIQVGQVLTIPPKEG